MPLTNLNNKHLSDTQKTSVESILTSLEKELAPINVEMTGEDRQQYGRINEQNKLLVNKSGDYYKNSPNLASPEVDWTEFLNDAASRAFYEGIINRLEALLTRLKNAKILHDYDSYQAALQDYAYTAYRAGSGAPGFEQKQSEMKQFFARTGKPLASGDSTPSPQSEPLK